MLEEYGLTIVHVAGEKNNAADALSRLPILENDLDTVEWGQTTNKPLQYADRIPQEINQLLDNEVLLPLALEERLKNKKFPLAPDMIQWYQQEDEKLQKKLRSKTTDSYTSKEIKGFDLVHYRNKIFVPKKLRKRILDWYHKLLCHPGIDQMRKSIRSLFVWPKMDEEIQEFCRTCRTCQLAKRERKKYGKLPPKAAEETMWKRVNVDLWGPKTVKY